MDAAAVSGPEAAVGETLAQFRVSLQAAVQEVQVDVKAFKQRIEQKIDELCASSGPLAGAVAKLQEDNRQLRTKLEALGCLVEGLTNGKLGGPAQAQQEESTENGHVEAAAESQKAVGAERQSCQSMSSDPSESSGALRSPAPPPWRAKRHAETNVSVCTVPVVDFQPATMLLG